MIFLLQQNSLKKYKVLNRDLAGGFGTATHFGDSILTRILTFSKKKTVSLPSIDLAYIASVLKRNGKDVVYADDIDRITNEAKLIIIRSSIVDYNSDIQASQRLKDKLGDKVKIGFIGTFSSIMPDLYLPYADFVLIGEGENYFLSHEDIAFDELKGIINVGRLINLDELPFPLWELYDYAKFSYFPALKSKPFFPILSSRGCSLSCAYYCPYPLISGRTVRYRSVENVIKEIKYLKNKYAMKSLLFRDPIFTFNKKRAALIAKEIMKSDIKVEWACETRLDLLDEKLIDLLYSAGLRAFNIGIESSNEDILKASKRKPIERNYQERMIRYCHKKGIKISAFYIIGLPEDNEESILQTIKYAKYLNTNIAQFTICTPYPATKFYDENRDLIFEKDWEKFDAYTPVFNYGKVSPNQLLKLKDYAHRSYYFRLKWGWTFLKNNLISS